MNKSAKGYRIEQFIRKILQGSGYSVTRSILSRGAFDLVATRGLERRHIQVKANRWPGKPEMSTIAEAEIQTESSGKKLIVTREVWRHKDHPGVKHNIKECVEVRMVYEDGSWLPFKIFIDGLVDL